MPKYMATRACIMHIYMRLYVLHYGGGLQFMSKLRAHPRPHVPCGRPERRCCPAPAQWNVCLLRMCARVGVLHSAENNAPPAGLHVFSCCPFGGVLVRIMNVHATHEVAGTRRVVYKFRSENVNKKNTEH